MFTQGALPHARVGAGVQGSACTGDDGDAGAPAALMRTCTHSRAHVWKVIALCFLRIYMSWRAVAVIVKEYPRQE